MGNKLDIVNNRSKILSVLKPVFVLLRINHWTTRFNLEPPRDCCSFCSSICKCAGESCDAETLPFAAVEDRDSNRTKRAALQNGFKKCCRIAAERPAAAVANFGCSGQHYEAV